MNLKPKTQADLCEFLSNAIEATQGISINWRILKKFVNDFEYDTCNAVAVSFDESIMKARLYEIYDRYSIQNIEC